jgi:hypothetical protein
MELVDALEKTTLLPSTSNNAINELIAFSRVGKYFQEYTQLFNGIDKRSKTGMSDDVLCNHFIICLTSRTLRTQATPQHAKSTTSLTILELQNFLINRLVVDSPYLGHAKATQDDNPCEGSRVNGHEKRLMQQR